MTYGHEFASVTTKEQPTYCPVVIDHNFPVEKPTFLCPKCPSVFRYKHNLYYHLKFECGQSPRFNCPYCVYCARHISNARRHVRTCHPGRAVYTIDLCKLQQRHPYNQASIWKIGTVSKTKDAGWHYEIRRWSSCEDPFLEALQLGRYWLRSETFY